MKLAIANSIIHSLIRTGTICSSSRWSILDSITTYRERWIPKSIHHCYWYGEQSGRGMIFKSKPLDTYAPGWFCFCLFHSLCCPLPLLISIFISLPWSFCRDRDDRDFCFLSLQGLFFWSQHVQFPRISLLFVISWPFVWICSIFLDWFISRHKMFRITMTEKFWWEISVFLRPKKI